jgi:hypothetical protein
MLDGVFFRGTTPTQIFPIPKPLTMDDLKDFTITYRQKNKNILIKHMEDTCKIKDIDPNTNIVIVLSQADTLMFNPKVKIVEVQIKGFSTGSDVFVLGNYRFRLEDSFDANEFDLDN